MTFHSAKGSFIVWGSKITQFKLEDIIQDVHYPYVTSLKIRKSSPVQLDSNEKEIVIVIQGMVC